MYADVVYSHDVIIHNVGGHRSTSLKACLAWGTVARCYRHLFISCVPSGSFGIASAFCMVGVGYGRALPACHVHPKLHLPLLLTCLEGALISFVQRTYLLTVTME